MFTVQYSRNVSEDKQKYELNIPLVVVIGTEGPIPIIQCVVVVHVALVVVLV